MWPCNFTRLSFVSTNGFLLTFVIYRKWDLIFYRQNCNTYTIFCIQNVETGITRKLCHLQTVFHVVNDFDKWTGCSLLAIIRGIHDLAAFIFLLLFSLTNRLHIKRRCYRTHVVIHEIISSLYWKFLQMPFCLCKSVQSIKNLL